MDLEAACGRLEEIKPPGEATPDLRRATRSPALARTSLGRPGRQGEGPAGGRGFSNHRTP